MLKHKSGGSERINEKYYIPQTPVLYRRDVFGFEDDVAKQFVKDFVDMNYKFENKLKTNISITLVR